MFDFFTSRRWLYWGVPGALLICFTIFMQVRIDVMINDWFGVFYGQIESSIKTPNSVPLNDFLVTLLDFVYLAGIWVAISVAVKWFVSHWTFRWRSSMVETYHKKYHKAAELEGSSQRVQEDTLKFARLVEDLGSNLVESFLTLVMFFPILVEKGSHITEIPFIGEISWPLVWVAIITAIGGTIILVAVGIKLPGIEYDIQANEAAYRKKLVLLERISEENPAEQNILTELYRDVRNIHYKSYFHYMYFNMVRLSYLQGMVIIPYIAMAPSIVAGFITLGLVRQITHAFSQVSSNLQYLVRSWPQVVELMSVYKRLREFEKNITMEKV